MSRWRERFRTSDAEARVQAALLEPIGDATSLHGAERLKQRIEAAWRKRGLAPPRIEIVPRVIVVGEERFERFELHSNMRNGKPVTA